MMRRPFLATRLELLLWLAAFAVLATTVRAAEDITQLSTIATNSPATLRRIVITKPRIVFHREFALEWPLICFTVSNKSQIVIARLYLDGSLKVPGRAVPLIEHAVNYVIPGGLEPGETRSFGLDADVIGGWSGVSRQAVQGAKFTLRLTAVEDSHGKRIRD